jgi:hypothetical protein
MSQDLECGEVGQFAKSRQHHPIGCSLVRASWLCSMMELMVPHLHQTRPTKFAVKNVNESPHDQTSLLSRSSTVSSACFGAFSRGGENGFVALSFCFVPHGWRNSVTETRATQPSRLASTPCPERRPADGVRPGRDCHFRQSSSRSNDQRFQLPARTNRAGLMMSVHRGGPECAGRPARSRWCKSITMKE